MAKRGRPPILDLHQRIMGDVVRLLEEARGPVRSSVIRRRVRGGHGEVDGAVRMLCAADVVKLVPGRGYVLARRSAVIS